MQDTDFGVEPQDSGERTAAEQAPEPLDALAAMPRQKAAGVIWRGFDSPDFSNWDNYQVQDDETGGVIQNRSPLAAERMVVKPVEDLTHRHYAELYNFYVHVTVNPCHTGVSRSELIHRPARGTAEGIEYYYRWSTWFPRDLKKHIEFPVGPGIGGVWQVITQWHQASDSGSPPLLLSAKSNKNTQNEPYIGLELSERSEPLVWKTPLVYNTWHNFVLFVRFSNTISDAPDKGGKVKLWYSTHMSLPQPVTPFLSVRTTSASDVTKGPYLKHGLYRSKDFYGPLVSHLVHCGIVEGDSLDSVLAP